MQLSIWLVTIPPPGPLIFSIKIPAPGQLFSAKLRPKNETIIPTPRHNLPSLNAKISMKKEHNTIKAVSFQIFHNLSISQFSFFVRVKYSQVYIQHLRLMLFEVWRQFENHSQCRKVFLSDYADMCHTHLSRIFCKLNVLPVSRF